MSGASDSTKDIAVVDVEEQDKEFKELPKENIAEEVPTTPNETKEEEKPKDVGGVEEQEAKEDVKGSTMEEVRLGEGQEGKEAKEESSESQQVEDEESSESEKKVRFSGEVKEIPVKYQDIKDDIVEDMPEELAIKAKIELHETKTSRTEKLRMIKARLGEEKMNCISDLESEEDLDNFLLRFLRARKFETDRTLKLLSHFENVYTEKHFGEVTIKSVQQIFDLGILEVLPTLDKKFSSPVLVVRFTHLDLKRFTTISILQALFFMLMEEIKDHLGQVNGFTIVVDLKGLRYVMVKELDTSALNIAVKMLQDCFPARFKGLYFVNAPGYFSVAWKVISSMLREKFRERCIVLKEGYDLLLDRIGGPERLPRNLGGELIYENRKWISERFNDIEVEYRPWKFKHMALDVSQLVELPSRFGMDVRRTGNLVIVLGIKKGLLADRLGLVLGDILWTQNDRDIHSINDIKLNIVPGKPIKLTVLRQAGRADILQEQLQRAKEMAKAREQKQVAVAEGLREKEERLKKLEFELAERERKLKEAEEKMGLQGET